MLEKERFLAIKKLAHDIREDNRKIFKSFKKLPFDEAVERKNDFIDSVIENMNIAFSDGDKVEKKNRCLELTSLSHSEIARSKVIQKIKIFVI